MNIFIGGSDASAAALLGEVFASHPRMLAYNEHSLLGGRSGAVDLLRGTCDLAMFERRLFRVRLSELNETFAKTMPGRYELLPRKSAKRLFSAAFDGQEVAVGLGVFVRGVNLIAMNEAAKAYWAEIRTLARTDVHLLHWLYPGMRYVHLFRSPEEGYMAVAGENRGPDALASFIFDYKRATLRALSALKTLPSENIIALSLDTLLDSPKDLLARIFDFCGVSYSQDFLTQATDMLATNTRAPADQKTETTEMAPNEQRLLLKHCQHLHRSCQALEQELSGAW